MPRTSEVPVARMRRDAWDRLVERYEAADAKADAAYLATDDAAGEAAQREADERYEALRRIAERYEDQLLSSDAPSGEAARYQLKVYALRFQLVDLDDAPMPGEDEAARVMRRFFVGLCCATGYSPQQVEPVL